MKSKGIIIIGVIAAVLLAGIGLLSVQNVKNASIDFTNDGFILSTTKDDQGPVSEQYYFNADTSYRESYEDSISFKDVNGDKVSVGTDNFVHYQEGSMYGLTDSVILDTDILADQQISYYSVTSKSILAKAGAAYNINNAGETLSIANYIWKISDQNYMLVSDQIVLYISEEPLQTFEGFVQVQYIDDGVVYLVNQQGTYSTISSDAYLELNNGIRVYLGSKNVSDANGIKMNLTDMVVDSEANIEIIPDEDYTIEVDKTPRIVVNAENGEDGHTGVIGKTGNNGDEGQDGEEGESGEPGKAGTQGSNGNNGITGAPGVTGGTDTLVRNGSDGTPAPYKNQEYMPLFNGTISTKSYGAVTNLTYEENECYVVDAIARIIQVDSNTIVWEKNIKDDLKKQMDPIVVDSLLQGTDYQFVIQSTYYSNVQDELVDTPITRSVFSQPFKTDSFGVSMKKEYATDHSIAVTITKDLEDCDVKTLYVKYKDADGTLLGFGVYTDPVSGAQSNEIDVSLMQKGDTATFLFDGSDLPDGLLKSNTPYYMQIDAEVTKIEPNGHETVVVPKSAFIPQEYYTLKKAPTIIIQNAYEAMQSAKFNIIPSVSDPENGIVKIKYEIYDTETGTLKYTKTYDGIENFSESTAYIFKSVSDRTKNYDVYAIAIFDNNDRLVEYKSPCFTYTPPDQAWPLLYEEANSLKISPSTAEFSLRLEDRFVTIPENATFKIAYQTYYDDEHGNSNITKSENAVVQRVFLENDLDNWPVTGGNIRQVNWRSDSEKHEFNFNFNLQGLLRGHTYSVTIIVSDINVNSVDYKDYTIGRYTFTTSSAYRGLTIHGQTADGRPRNEPFMIDLWFSPESESAEANDTESVKTLGLSNFADLTARALSYVKIEMYSDPGWSPESYMGAYDLKVPAYEYNTYVENGGQVTYTDLVYPTHDVYSSLYRFDNQVYRNAYTRNGNPPDSVLAASGTDLHDQRITIKGSDFVDSNGNPAQFGGIIDNTVYLKVAKAYDYVYGYGSDWRYGNSGSYIDENAITISGFIIVDGVEDSYPETIKYYPFNITPRYNSDTLTSTSNPTIAELIQSSNIASFTNAQIQELYDKQRLLKSGTVTGVKIEGPKEWLRYAKYVRYNILDINDASGEEDDLVCTSEWLEVKKEGNTKIMPSWNYFFDANEGDITRGQNFRVTMEIALTSHHGTEFPTDPVIGDHMIYPTQVTLASESDYTEITSENKLYDKQKPDVYKIPYRGTTNENTDVEDQFLIKYDDPDHALMYKNNVVSASNILVYVNDVEQSDIRLTNYGFIREGYYSLERVPVDYAEGGTNRYAHFKYMPNEYASSTDSISIFSEQTYNEGANIQLLASFEDDSHTVHTPVATLTNASNLKIPVFVKGDVNDIIRADLSIGDGTTSVTLLNRTVSGGDTYGDINEAEINVRTLDLLGLDGTKELTYEIKVYYDSGKYGAFYTKKSEGVDYYVLESSNLYVPDSGFEQQYTYGAKSSNYVYECGENYDFSVDNLPVKANVIACEGTIAELGDILPDVNVAVTPGFLSAKLDIFVRSGHTLNKAQGLTLKVYKESDPGSVQSYHLSWPDPNEATAQWQQIIKELNREKYIYELYGVGTNTGREFKLASGSFQPLREIKFYIPDLRIIHNSTNRLDKNLVSALATTQPIYSYDLDGISAKLELYKDGDLKRSMDLTNGDLIAQFTGNNEETLNTPISIPFVPGSNSVVGDDSVYSVKAVLYKDGATITDFGDIGELEKSYSPEEFDSTALYVSAQGTTSLTLDQGNHETIQISYDITGIDSKRLITGSGNDKADVIASLLRYKDDGSTEVVSTRELCFTIVNGSLRKQTITFDNLLKNTRYQLQLNAIVDTKNEGPAPITTAAVSSDNVVGLSTILTTPGSSLINIENVNLFAFNQETNKSDYIQFIGDNLDQISGIKYVISDLTDGNNPITYPTVTYSSNDYNWGTTEYSNISGTYYLHVPELSDTSHQYLINIMLYSDSACENLEMQLTRVYTGEASGSQPGAPLAAFPVLKKILSIFK